ncbi:MAG TPA: alkaline phosphatase family protein [Puia sp.]|jgi:phospholipase C|nr:alkaline phosphatase family protein [Puia sp.]
MAGIIDQVQTIVLVMMENRSFDHMLGHLTLDNPALALNGLRTENLDKYINEYLGTPYPVYERPDDNELSWDLPHEAGPVKTQLRQNPVSKEYTMQGFVEAFAKSINTTPNPEADPMGYFSKEFTPVTNFFATNFCVCDNWYSPIPTSTQPNRTMAFSGDSSIHDTKFQLIPIPGDLFHWMDDPAHPVRWRVYHDGFSFFSLYNDLWPYVLGPQFLRTESLYADLSQEPDEHSPQVIIIEPNYHDAPHFGSKHPNDNHAPLAIGWGEDFLRRTYQAVSSNKTRWNSTVMIVYYDEHGGFFDHQPPPKIPYTTIGGDGFPFDSLGPRIPAIIISPLVKKESICPALFDHTSVLQFIAEKFAPDKTYSIPVTNRKDLGIRSISAALNNTTVYDAPSAPTDIFTPLVTLGKGLSVPPESEMQKAFEFAALQLITQKPAEVKIKYPELFQWRDEDAKSVGTATMAATAPMLVASAPVSNENIIKKTVPQSKVVKSGNKKPGKGKKKKT